MFAAALIGLGTACTLTFLPEGMQVEYLILSGVSCGAAHLFGSAISNRPGESVLRWSVLAVFLLGYYLQLWLILADADFLRDQPVAMASAVDPEVIIRAYRVLAPTFVGVAFAVAAISRIRTRRPPPEYCAARRAVPARRAIFLAVIIAAGALVTMTSLNIAIMGAEAEPLPYRLAGWVVYSLRILVPALLLFAAWVGESLGKRRLMWSAVVVLGAAAVGDLLVTTSKQGIVMAVLRYGMLMYLMGRFTRTRRVGVAAALLALAISFPLFMALRWERVSGMDIAAAVAAARQADRIDSGAIQRMRLAAVRVSGMACLLPVVGRDEVRPDLAIAGLFGGAGIGAFTTQQVYGFDPSVPTGFAPGLLGWFFVAMGGLLAPVGVVALVVVLELSWRALWRMPLIARSVASILFMELALSVLVDGVLERIPLLLVVMAGAVFVIEVLARITGRAPIRHVASANPT